MIPPRVQSSRIWTIPVTFPKKRTDRIKYPPPLYRNEMDTSKFRTTLDRLSNTNSRNDKKDIIREVSDSPAAISFLSGSEFDDAGLGKKTVLSCVNDVYGEIDGKPTVSESLARSVTRTGQEKTRSMEQVRTDMEELAATSGNGMKSLLRSLLKAYTYPEVLTHACLNDWPTGVSDTTIANALDIRDVLPFYDSVVEAVEVPSPIAEPVVHNAFDPMLAKSESNLPEDRSDMVAQPKLDGYRLLLHVTNDRAKAFTRRRNEVTESLPELAEIDWPDGEWILDCEVIAETGNYSDTSERIGRKAENVDREIEMEFGLFDVIAHNGRRIYELPFKERHGWTCMVADLTPDDRVEALPIYSNEADAKAVWGEYEGLIWKALGEPYEFKRSSSWVKEKHQDEKVDVIISDVIEGEGRLDGTMGKLSVESREGVELGNVGTGFSDTQRDEMWDNSDEWLGGVIEVEAEAFDDGLRFPRYKRDRRDDGTADGIEKIRDVMPEA